VLNGGELGVSGAGGRASLQTLLAEPDFGLACFLLSVLGEGTFLNLLSFIERHAPDPVTGRVAHLALQDEARHVAFALAHPESGGIPNVSNSTSKTRGVRTVGRRLESARALVASLLVATVMGPLGASPAAADTSAVLVAEQTYTPSSPACTFTSRLTETLANG